MKYVHANYMVERKQIPIKYILCLTIREYRRGDAFTKIF